MIIFIGGAGGRLGNQIFQYAFIKSISNKNELILASGIEDFLEVFEVEDIINVTQKKRYLRRFVFRVAVPMLNLLSFFRIISVIEVNYEYVNGLKAESTAYSTKKGLLSSIKYIKFGFFQSEVFFNRDVVDSIKIKSEYIRQAEEYFKDIPKDSNKIFVHIRRGDYKNFKIFGESALLPMKYYKDLIDVFIRNDQNCFFILLSDEPDFIEEEFKYLSNKKIALNNHPGTDFAIIIKCRSGILSTSTFGWWAAYMIKNKGTIFAPKYWLGFNSKIEFPIKSFPSFAKEVEI